MTDENLENLDSENEETTADAETADENDAAALREKNNELADKNRQLFIRAKKAEGFEFDEGSKRWVKKEKPAERKPESRVTPEATTGELSETQLDYLDVKGITDESDIKVIQEVMKRTGMTVRQALTDDYVRTRLETNKERRANEAATPNSRRGGQAQNDRFEHFMAEYERTRKLPDDFDMRVRVVEAAEKKHSTKTPPWRRG